MKIRAIHLMLLITSMLLVIACQNEEPSEKLGKAIEEDSLLGLVVLPYDVPTQIQPIATEIAYEAARMGNYVGSIC